jgi:PAS domain S-box-containing protein
MNLKIKDLIDFEKINVLLDDFNKVTGFATAILDLEGNVLAKSGWRQICTDFHRIHPETSKKCTESDIHLAGKITEGKKYHCYKCLNGLIDVASPLIINGKHIGNLFTGQLFFEKPDREFFIKQAVEYGFKQKKYLEALDKVPVVSEDKVNTSIKFLLNITQLICELMLNKAEQIELNDTLIKSEEKYQGVVENLMEGFYKVTVDGTLLHYNPEFVRILGLDPDKDHTGINLPDFWQNPEDRKDYLGDFLKNGFVKNYEINAKKIDGEKIVVQTNSRLIKDVNGEPLMIEGTFLDITERKRLEERYSKAFNVGPNGLTITRISDGKFVEANDSFLKLFDYSRVEVIGRTSADLNMWTVEESQKLIKYQLESKSLESFELSAKTKSGRTVNILFSSKQIMMDGVDYHITSIVDITEQKQAEQALKNSEEQLNLVINASPIGICTVDPLGNFSTTNQAYEQMVGYSKEECRSLSFFDVTHPNDRPKNKKLFQSMFSLETTNFSMKKRYIRKDGSEIDVAVHAIGIMDSDGNVRFGTAFVDDITERKRAEHALSESEERFRKISENAPVLINSFDKDGRCLFWNKQCNKTFGWTIEEINEHEVAMALFYPDSAVCEEVIRTTTTDPDGSFREWHPVTKDGKILSIMWANFSLPNGQVFSMGYDITERKRAEDELSYERTLLEAVINNIPVLLTRYNPNSNLLYLNNEFEKTLV